MKTRWQVRARKDAHERTRAREVEGVPELLRRRDAAIVAARGLEGHRRELAQRLLLFIGRLLSTSRASLAQLERSSMRELTDGERKIYAQRAHVELDMIEARLREWGCLIVLLLCAACSYPTTTTVYEIADRDAGAPDASADADLAIDASHDAGAPDAIVSPEATIVDASPDAEVYDGPRIPQVECKVDDVCGPYTNGTVFTLCNGANAPPSAVDIFFADDGGSHVCRAGEYPFQVRDCATGTRCTVLLPQSAGGEYCAGRCL